MSTGDVTGKGKHETALLKANITDQLNRLLTQLEDLEELKEEFSLEEYEETKAETLDQLREFQTFLSKSLSGDLTLVDEFGTAQLAIQAAVSQAFKTPEVIRLFAQRQPDMLRIRLDSVRREYKVKKINKEMYIRMSVEILLALKKMESELSPEESEFLDTYGSNSSVALEDASAGESVNTSNQNALLSQASDQIKRAAK